MSYFTIKEEQQKMFTQLPKALLYEDKYKPMSNDSKILYSFLVDRVSLSLKNGYTDELGRVYIKCSEITMAEILNKSEKTVRKFKKELIDKGLLEQPDAKNEKTKYYVKQPDVTVAKLEDYIADFQEVVKEKAKKEIERNREYRIKKAHNKVADFKAKLCNGNNDRSVENTELQSEKSLKPLETLATVKTTVMHQSKLPYSNNDFSNTDLLSMYVCTGEPANTDYRSFNSAFVNLYSTYLVPSTELIDILMSYEEVFDYELFEYLFLEVYNKFKAGRVSNIERYLITTLDGQSSRRIFTLPEYIEYKAEFNTKNYNRTNTQPKRSIKQPVAPKAPEVKDQPEVPVSEPKHEIPNNSDSTLEKLRFRQANDLMSVEYMDMSLEELKSVVAERKEKEMQIETLMNSYNANMFDEETRRRFAMQALGLIY